MRRGDISEVFGNAFILFDSFPEIARHRIRNRQMLKIEPVERRQINVARDDFSLGIRAIEHRQHIVCRRQRECAVVMPGESQVAVMPIIVADRLPFVAVAVDA